MIGMHAIISKLRSRRGASLSIALLLFLVCAVIGSLVLVAGTAAAGRLARLGESEQRFHAVNSAAELIVDQLCGKDNKVTVGIKKEPDGTGFKYTNTLPVKPGTLAADLATYIVYGNLNIAETGNEAQYNKCTQEELYKEKTFTYELTVDGHADIPKVLVTARFINGYQLNLTVEAGEGAQIFRLPTIILETDPPRGVNEEDKIEYTFNWRTPKG